MCQEETIIDTPGKSLKYGNDLIKLVAVYYATLLKKGAAQQELDSLKNFSKIMKTHYNEDVTKRAMENMCLKKFKKPNNLPFTNDVVKLYNFVESSIDKLLQKSLATTSDYSKLVDLLMSKIVIFNRKRVGDVQSITKKEYIEWLERDDRKVEDESLTQLDDLEKHLS